MQTKDSGFEIVSLPARERSAISDGYSATNSHSSEEEIVIAKPSRIVVSGDGSAPEYTNQLIFAEAWGEFARVASVKMFLEICDKLPVSPLRHSLRVSAHRMHHHPAHKLLLVKETMKGMFPGFEKDYDTRQVLWQTLAGLAGKDYDIEKLCKGVFVLPE